MTARIDGVALQRPGESPADEDLRERAWGELLRQQAVRRGLLPAGAHAVAPALTAEDERVLLRMLDEEIAQPRPSEDECRRYHAAHRPRFTEGQQVLLRHILFAVTDGVDVDALAGRAEQALRELLRHDALSGRFGELARELSNCPSGAAGGELGWITPRDCAGELARELFFQDPPLAAGRVHPRLLHSRYGLHIVEVLARQTGREPAYEELRERIATELAQRSRATALHQYIRLLAGRSHVEGLELEAAHSPLVQ